MFLITCPVIFDQFIWMENIRADLPAPSSFGEFAAQALVDGVLVAESEIMCTVRSIKGKETGR